jgi:hydrogenase maturation protein HypF
MRVVSTMIERRFQTVDTSSCGRVFDAVSALLGVCLESRYEAEAAMELEAAANDDNAVFPFDLAAGEIDLRETIRALIGGIRRGDSVTSLSARFHNTLARAIVAACEDVRRSDGLSRVCLSGGSFQNMRLLEATVSGLEAAGFEVYWQSEVPPNDGGLSLGQAVIACAKVAGW